MVAQVRRLLAYRSLLWALSTADLRARHRQSLLGMTWALLQPLAMMVVFTVVFGLIVKIPADGVPYAVFAYLGLVGWLFCSNSLSAGVPSLVSNMSLVSKASFPREVIPLSKLAATGVDFLVGLLGLGLLLLIYRLPLHPTVLAVPFVMLLQTMLVTGFVLLGSALYVLKRDVGAILPLVLYVWMFLSPVLYPVTLVPDRFRWMYELNPMAAILDAYRALILAGIWPAGGSVLLMALTASLSLLAGYGFFKSVEMRFADVM